MSMTPAADGLLPTLSPQPAALKRVNSFEGVPIYDRADVVQRGSVEVDRKARAFLFLGFAFIDFFFFKGAGMHALGLLFLIFSIYLFATKPKLTNQ
jgi:hypothetical protein